jgi:hypothetical protein
MSQPTDPTDPPFIETQTLPTSDMPYIEPLPSRPDPAAFLHADHVPQYQEPSLLYPSAPTQPPPPSQPPSAPVYFPLLYPTQPLGRRRGVGLLIGLLIGIILMVALGVGFIVRSGLLAATASSTNGVAISTHVPSGSAPNGGGTATATPTPATDGGGGGGPVVAGQPTATLAPMVTPSPTGTLAPGTPAPNATPTATATDAPTATATSPSDTPTLVPPLSVKVGCLATFGHKSAQFCVNTAATATLAITVRDCDGVIDPNAPKSGTADSIGYYFANWVPRQLVGGCRTATISVTATLGNQKGSGQGTLNFG